ncbi:hypothetical protein GCM10010869_06280 [Mesorhizobium tianshanense]|uniref:Uncharacterized protein n=1 Tax=Mesorhizobium tianshanense TaxID=39844 RepID=A0A562NLU1_9HYPH|nr:hypothetical protein [Mesorhizobium tianshanense]TWI33093.1 hypothetical protein IQ26_04093 [Mesorhizobium tianshanense]GLS35040.1 hypothetical protein GCM10010869_06280 [Mesorhizobium tianshanense]
MDDNDAERARSLIKDVEFFNVDSGHGFHVEKPGGFNRIMLRVGSGLSGQQSRR